MLSQKVLSKDQIESKYSLKANFAKQQSQKHPQTYRPILQQNFEISEYTLPPKCRTPAYQPRRKEELAQPTIQSIRKKYQNQFGVSYKPEKISPLKDLNNYSSPSKHQYNRFAEQKSTLQRTLSIVNVQSSNPNLQAKKITNQSSFASKNVDPRKNQIFQRINRTPTYNKHSVQKFRTVDNQKDVKFNPCWKDDHKISTIELTKCSQGPTTRTNSQRVQSIDKINDRIKQLLGAVKECHQQNENNLKNTEVKSRLQNFFRKKGSEECGYRIVQGNSQTVNLKSYHSNYLSHQNNSNIDKLTTHRALSIDQKQADKISRSLPKSQPRDIDMQLKRIQAKFQRTQKFEKTPSNNHSQSTLNRNLYPKSPKIETITSKYSKQCLNKHHSEQFINSKSMLSNSKKQFRKKKCKNEIMEENQQYEEEIASQSTKNNQTYPHLSNIPKAEELTFKIIPIQCTSEIENQPKNQIKRFTYCLKQQITIDEQFRNAKIWLESQKNPSRWQQVSKFLQNSNIKLEQYMIQQQFKNSLEQHNPFFTTKNTGETILGVVNKYLAAKDYWENNILHKFDMNKMKQQGFDEKKFDLENKGHLSIEDFVRFVNIETGSFFRNRDLVLTYRRLTPSNKISFDDFAGKISK